MLIGKKKVFHHWHKNHASEKWMQCLALLEMPKPFFECKVLFFYQDKYYLLLKNTFSGTVNLLSMDLYLRKWAYEREILQSGFENKVSEVWNYIIDLEN